MSTLQLLQPWLNVVGILLDCIGILLLAREWWIAMDADGREAEIERREEMMRPRPNQVQLQGPHHDVHADMRRRMSFQQRQQRRSATWKARQAWFVASLVIILLGYILQMIGSVPL
ncbi:MAG: hypothetical protein AAF211_22070 [Myxococcota bacterium]